MAPNHPDQDAPLLDPVVEIANSGQPGGLEVTISDAQMYRGSANPELEGAIGHFILGTGWAIKTSSN